MRDALDTKTVKLGRRTYTINVYHDESTDSPLDRDEGVFITYSSTAREKYGNTPLDQDEHESIGRRIEMFNDPDAQKKHALASALADEDDSAPLGEPLIGLPVYVYQHGQVSMRTSSFSCPWDSGQSGFIYVTKKTALDWQGGKRLTKRKIKNVLGSLSAIVEEYGQWCNGECYYYTVTDENGQRIDDLGCGGFIGTDWLYEDAESNIKHHHSSRVKDACKRRATAAKERIERLFWAARGLVTA